MTQQLKTSNYNEKKIFWQSSFVENNFTTGQLTRCIRGSHLRSRDVLYQKSHIDTCSLLHQEHLLKTDSLNYCCHHSAWLYNTIDTAILWYTTILWQCSCFSSLHFCRLSVSVLQFLLAVFGSISVSRFLDTALQFHPIRLLQTWKTLWIT